MILMMKESMALLHGKSNFRLLLSNVSRKKRALNTSIKILFIFENVLLVLNITSVVVKMEQGLLFTTVLKLW